MTRCYVLALYALAELATAALGFASWSNTRHELMAAAFALWMHWLWNCTAKEPA